MPATRVANSCWDASSVTADATSQAAAVTDSLVSSISRAQVLDRLEGADLLAELLAHAGVLHRRVEAPPRDPRGLGGGERDDERARAARREVGDDGALDGGQVAEGGTTGQVGVGAGREVDALEGHEHAPRRPTTTRAWVAPGASWTTEPSSDSGDRAGRRRRATTEATAEPRSGPGSSAAAHASTATARSVSEPPSAVMESSPISAIAEVISGERRGGVVLRRPGSLDPAERARPLPEGVGQLDVVVADPDRHGCLLSLAKLERVPIMP